MKYCGYKIIGIAVNKKSGKLYHITSKYMTVTGDFISAFASNTDGTPKGGNITILQKNVTIISGKYSQIK